MQLLIDLQVDNQKRKAFGGEGSSAMSRDASGPGHRDNAVRYCLELIEKRKPKPRLGIFIKRNLFDQFQLCIRMNPDFAQMKERRIRAIRSVTAAVGAEPF
jgi:hypothetical protein